MRSETRSILSGISLSACATALLFQILYGDYLVKIKDFSALTDTSYFIARVSAMLLAATLIFNAAVYVVAYIKQSKK